MIYTSYYSIINKLPISKYKFVQISRGNPAKNIVKSKIEELIPSWDLITEVKEGKISEEEYDRRYIQQLDNIGFYLINDLIIEEMEPDRDLVLLCYEGANKHCHRHVFANWFNDKIGKDYIKEYKLN